MKGEISLFHDFHLIYWFVVCAFHSSLLYFPGRKKVYAKCDQKRFTIPSKLKAKAAAQFKWSCYVKGDDESDMSRCMENATKVLEFPNLPDLTVSPINQFQCGGMYVLFCYCPNIYFVLFVFENFHVSKTC